MTKIQRETEKGTWQNTLLQNVHNLPILTMNKFWIFVHLKLVFCFVLVHICSSPCSICHQRQRMGCYRSQSWRCSSSRAPPWGWWSPRWPPPGRPWRSSARSISPTSMTAHSPACPWLKTSYEIRSIEKYGRPTSRKPCQRDPCCPLDCKDRLDWSHQCRTLWKQNRTDDEIDLGRFCPGWKFMKGKRCFGWRGWWPGSFVAMQEAEKKEEG